MFTQKYHVSLNQQNSYYTKKCIICKILKSNTKKLNDKNICESCAKEIYTLFSKKKLFCNRKGCNGESFWDEELTKKWNWGTRDQLKIYRCARCLEFGPKRAFREQEEI